jgi:ABC-type antimicrobial peptide transport system permease subunit
VAVYARTRLDEATLLQAVPRVVATLDRDLPVEGLWSMDRQIKDNVGQDRVVSMLSAAFAILATLLAALGLYGVLAYTVQQRTREIGLRMALGADAARVRRLVLGRVGWMTLAGAGVGVAAAMILGWLAAAQFFQLAFYDPAVFTGSTALLSAVAFTAGLIPALRASRVSPMTALRND